MDAVELVASNSSAGEDDENCEREVCLKRVGRNSEWLCLGDSTEITVGRGLNVTYQLLSPINPLMISRLHCTFKQREDGQWTVTDQKSLNGVWVNGKRVPAEKPHCLHIGDSLQLGVPINGTIDYEYILCCLPKKDITPYLAKVSGENAPSILKKTKRKSNNILDGTEPSTSSKPKRYRRSIADNTPDQSCPVVEDQARARTKQPEVSSSSKHVHGIDVRSEGTSNPCDLDSLQRFSQNILMLREQVDDTQRQVASLKGEPQQVDPVRGEQFTVLQKHLQTLTTKMRRMETLEKSFSETKKQMAAEKSQQEEDVLKKQLEDALQEQKKVMEELTFSRQDFQKILLAKDNDLLAKDKELQMTKERAQAQKDEVVTQVTEVLENELQCIICSELFIEAVNLNCAHSFCMRCIGEWRKKKNECPICRREIQSQTRCLALDNCIERMVENLSPEMKERRQALVAERKAAEPLVIPDEDSTHSISSLNDSDDDSVLSLDSSSNSVISVNSESRRFRPDLFSSSSYTDEDDVI